MMNSTSSNRIAEKVAARFGIPVKDIGNDPVASQVLNRVMLTMTNNQGAGPSKGFRHGGYTAHEPYTGNSGSSEDMDRARMNARNDAAAAAEAAAYAKANPTPIDAAAAAKATAAQKTATEKEKEQEAAAEKAATDAAEYATKTAADLAGSRKTIQDKINSAGLELGRLQGGDQTNPKIAEKVASKQEEITKLQAELSAVGTAQGAEVSTAQNKLASDAITDPTSLATDTPVDKIKEAPDQILDSDEGDAGDATKATAKKVTTTDTADDPETITPTSVSTSDSQTAVEKALADVKSAQGDDPDSIVAAQGDSKNIEGLGLDKVEQIDAAQKVIPPEKRKIETDELVEGSAVDMALVKEITDIKAALADPSKAATVKGQLSELMKEFDGGDPPAWAAGPMRAASAIMSARGLGASSMAGQAIVQAAMESALPIALQDAATFAKFETLNLSNRQQTAIFAAEQRANFLKLDFDQAFQTRVANAAKISDIANVNFTAEQQVALENARMAQTVDITNLNAKNAKVLADAAAMADMDMANLSNLQQAKVENAKNFLAMDMANLSNDQQTVIFKAKALQDSILTDTAAENATKQFNATSENQTNQFMATIKNSVSQFNASQANAMEQFNVSEVNAIEKFNTEQVNARDQFNTTNSMIIAQANAVWRQSLSTTNMAAQNDANMQDAKIANGFTASVVDQIWQRERDLMSFAWKSSESYQDRLNNILTAQMGVDASASAAATQASASKSSALGMAAMAIFNWGKPF